MLRKQAINSLLIRTITMELTLYCGGDSPEFARVKNILKGANGRPIGVANDKPILDSRIYEVEYLNGYAK